MNRLVIKFGGSSVATIDKIKAVAKVIIDRKKDYEQIVVVVSAMGKTTNGLIQMANDLSAYPAEREMDMLLATGEMVSASLLSIYLQSIGEKSVALTGFQAGFETIGSHQVSKISNVITDRLIKELNDGKIVVVTGFQGMNENGDFTTLGRGGSDTSAVAIAAVLKARCEILTDVNGIYTVDPRIRKTAKKIDYISYQETMEMANLGAKVIEPRSVEMALRYDVPLFIGLNTGDLNGTNIIKEEDIVEQNIITNISNKNDVLLVKIFKKGSNEFGISEALKQLAQNDINIDMINTIVEENAVGYKITTNLVSKNKTKQVLDEMGLDCEFKENLSKVSIIGSAMRNQVGVAARAFDILSKESVPFYEVSTSEISISYLVDESKSNKLVNAFADEFNL